MTKINIPRIKFHSKEDAAFIYELPKSEEILENYKPEIKLDLTDLIEFYNVKLYFDNQLYLQNWTEEKISIYRNITDQTFKRLKESILSINDDTIEIELEKLDYDYIENFWSLLNNLGVFKNISEKTFSNLLYNNQGQIYDIIKQKKLIEKFDIIIRDFLIDYKSSAEILLSSIEEKDTFNNKTTNYFPKSLSISDKEKIINAYLDSEEPNLNYLRLIQNSIDSNEIRLNAKTRLKAKKKVEELNTKLFQKGNSWKFGISVSFDKDQKEPIKSNRDSSNLEISYGEGFVDQFTDNISLFRTFKYLFYFIDEKSLITLVSKRSELDVLERINMKSKNEYETGFAFLRKENLANIQLLIYDHYLHRKGNNIETLINSYIDFINEKLNPHKLLFKISLTGKSYLEKIRTVSPDYEFLLKQYKTYVDEKCIDLELIQINSAPIRFSEIYSVKKNKYLYSNHILILQLKYFFFSDQNSLFYVNNFENKYNNLYDLLTNENVKFEFFKTYQKETIKNLIKDGYLKRDNQDNVLLNKVNLIYLIGELHKVEVISYWNYPKSIRGSLDELIDSGLVNIENTLFTRQEVDYLNYYLNKKKFTNGFDLRNKYLHGTNSFVDDEHKVDYYKLLKIIILTLFKIEDDIIETEKQTEVLV